MTLLDDFLVRAVLAGLGVSLAAAPLGCFVVWRRMAYFGDATAHAAILGVALGLMLNISIFATAMVIALIMAVAVSALSGRGFSSDTMLGVMSHSTLAIGLVAVSFIEGVRVDLMAYLFGDILAVDRSDLAVIWIGALLALFLVVQRWSTLLTATLNPDLAYASGISPRKEQMVLSVALALVVAVAIKVVGVLLIAALLIIPAASARAVSRTPEGMAIYATLIAAASVVGGLAGSYYLDSPTGPTIVCFAAGFFLGTSILRLARGTA